MTVRRVFTTILIFATVLTACTTVPQGASESGSKAPPGWVTKTPRSTGEHTYFVGKGDDSTGKLAGAEAKAARSLAAKVARSIGAAVTARPTPETTLDLKRIEQQLTETIAGAAGSKVPGFAVAGRWVERQGSRVTVYLLGSYSTSALSEQRSRLAELERERTDPAAVYEARGSELLSNGKPYEAAIQFMHAALAASEALTVNREEEFGRNIRNAEAAIGEIRLEIRTNDLRGNLGEKLSRPFLLEVTVNGNSQEPVANVPFRITYPVPGDNATVDKRSMSATSDAEGRLSFELPAPRIFGDQSVVAALDLQRELEPLLHAAGGSKELVASLEKKIGSVHAVFHYRATSRAATIPTGVLVMDLDRGGTPIPDDDTASGIESALTQAGFDILPIPSNRSILGIDLPDLVKILRNNFGSKIDRAIVGQARISGFEHSDGNYVVKVTGHVEVAELASGKVLYSTSLVKLSRASDASSAINAAFKDLGTSIANEIKNRLR